MRENEPNGANEPNDAATEAASEAVTEEAVFTPEEEVPTTEEVSAAPTQSTITIEDFLKAQEDLYQRLMTELERRFAAATKAGTDGTDNSDKSDKSDRSDKSDMSDKSDLSDKAEQPGPGVPTFLSHLRPGFWE